MFSTDENADVKINLTQGDTENFSAIDTPIYDFVLNYSKSDSVRFHMPGHKGVCRIGCEPFDITEIDGADVLYDNSTEKGIIQKSMENATRLFRTQKTLYSTEGSSHCIRAMLGAIKSCKGNKQNSKTVILALRNVHKAFIYAAAALDVDVEWIYPQRFTHLCNCFVTTDNIKAGIQQVIEKYGTKPDAVYLTSPDYMGNIADIESIAQICHKEGILLLVDNAHGAYLAFIDGYKHPIHAGADICCDSAHKTLPVLTGGAYLHFSTNCDVKYISAAENMLRIFGTTSPSYITMASLDLCNKYLSDEYSQKIGHTLNKIHETKQKLILMGFDVPNTEPLKIVIDFSKKDVSGNLFAKALIENDIFPEMYDEECVVLMITTENTDEEFARLLSIADEIMKFKEKFIKEKTETTNEDFNENYNLHHVIMSIRDAVFSNSEIISIEKSAGRVCAAPIVVCPPAIPIVISGEEITENDIKIMKKYGIYDVLVVI